jgi:hypothetical protein
MWMESCECIASEAEGLQIKASTLMWAMNHVAPQVFGENPIPRYLHGTEATILNCCDEHQTLMRSPYVQGGSTNLREQYVDEMPKSYGFNNLNSQHLFLADGTERRYFVLPEDYPLEQTTPPISLSAEHVSVKPKPSLAAQPAGLATSHCSKANSTVDYGSLSAHIRQAPPNEQDTSNMCKEMPLFDIYDEDHYCLNGMDEQLAKCFHKASENACSELLLKCFSKELKTEQTIACLYYALEQQQNDEKVAVYVL